MSNFEDDFVIGDGVVQEQTVSNSNDSFELEFESDDGIDLPQQSEPLTAEEFATESSQELVKESGFVFPDAIKTAQTGVRQGGSVQQVASTPKAVPNGNIQESKKVEKTTDDNSNVNSKKKLTWLWIVLAVVAVVFIMLIVKKLGNNDVTEPPVSGNQGTIAVGVDYNSSGRYALDVLQVALNTFDAEKVDAAVGLSEGDSYLAQEWAFVNDDLRRQDFIMRVCSVLQFKVPKVPQLDANGVPVLDSEGKEVLVESMLNNGEAVTVNIPDYLKITLTMEEDKVYIGRLFEASQYTEQDYDWNYNLANLMLQYICEKPNIPTKSVELVLPFGLGVDGVPYVKDDAELDKLLFSNEDFRNMCKKFSQICIDWTGSKAIEYTVKEEVKNPEYDDWYKIFIKYYNEDDGKFNKNKSKWEPWYLRDENNNLVLDENGEKIVNYYSIKAEDGTDWLQPAEYVLTEVTKTKQVPDPWEEERGIMYNWLGQYYIQHEYDGIGDTTIRVGDGTKKRPAGIGTTIITKVKDTDGVYRDVRVALKGYWTGADAIEYAERFSPRNRGFSSTSVVQLITYEVEIENLEDTPITLTSEMTLCDGNSNVSSRTGTIYGFTEDVTIESGEKVIINDWASSTELAQKYVCWGKSFSREYPMVYFDALAGTGEIPTYSAYKAFTGESSME